MRPIPLPVEILALLERQNIDPNDVAEIEFTASLTDPPVLRIKLQPSIDRITVEVIKEPAE